MSIQQGQRLPKSVPVHRLPRPADNFHRRSKGRCSSCPVNADSATLRAQPLAASGLLSVSPLPVLLQAIHPPRPIGSTVCASGPETSGVTAAAVEVSRNVQPPVRSARVGCRGLADVICLQPPPSG